MEPRPADPLERRPASGRFRLRRWAAYRYRRADPSAVATEELPVDEAGGLGDHLHREHVGGEGAGLALGLRNAPWRWRRWPGGGWQCWRHHRRGRPGSGPPVRGFHRQGQEAHLAAPVGEQPLLGAVDAPGVVGEDGFQGGGDTLVGGAQRRRSGRRAGDDLRVGGGGFSG